MCKTISGIVTYVDQQVQVYVSKKTDSHADIRAEFGIPDDTSASATRQVPCELMPVRGLGLTDVSEMDFMLDAEKPAWWNEEIRQQAIDQLYEAWKKRWKGLNYKFVGPVDLYSLTTMPSGVTIRAGESVDLSSLDEIPAGTTVKGKIVCLKGKTVL